MTDDSVRPGFWFKPKAFGYGATPVTWQGWTLTLAYVLSAVLLVNHAGWGHPAFYWLLIPSTVAMLWISWIKTDGEWGWRWGR
ncbi:hypothetical protein [Sphingomonas elodea]|uniref:hypothetical protein n=1 Tax=Sphingomonas elodea TaxID=179878 RepID=UPI00026312EE|nr:hypothetical protein [Sphingomonas elodea]